MEASRPASQSPHTVVLRSLQVSFKIAHMKWAYLYKVKVLLSSSETTSCIFTNLIDT